MKQVTCVLIYGLLASLGLTGCDALSVDAIPIPGHSYSDGYDIVAEFESTLNLPDRAKVVMDGITVGEVTKVSVAKDHVDVTARLRQGVEVPSTATAELQQATVLGDIYVSLDRPLDSEPQGPLLVPGGRIPLRQTVSPPQLEDTIANLANFIGSGSIQRAQDTLVRLNRITPPKDELRAVVSQVTTDVKQLADDTDTVDTLLTGLNQTSAVVDAYSQRLGFWFTPQGVRGFQRSTVISKTFGKLLPSVGTIYNGGYWLVPAITSLADATTAIQGQKQVVEREYPLYRQFINEYFLAEGKNPAINITSIVGPDGRELSGNVEQVLRMLGAVP